MSSRLTLLFVSNQSHLYSTFIDEFRGADFQVLIARNLVQAKSLLLTHYPSGIVVCHDCSRDDRTLAGPLKRIAPHLPVFLLTNREQPRVADIDCVWRSDLDDDVLTRGMAVFFRHLFSPQATIQRPTLVLDGGAPFLVGVRANGSS